MEAMNRVLPQLRASHANFVAISPQTVKQSFFMHDQHHLQFPLLSDSGNQVARQFGLVYRVPAEQQAIYSRTFTNLPFINGESSWELPIPATYLVGRSGEIQFAEANPDYTIRPEPLNLLSLLVK
jgi:peroxiredoxin